jgi:hypothetical protein
MTGRVWLGGDKKNGPMYLCKTVKYYYNTKM